MIRPKEITNVSRPQPARNDIENIRDHNEIEAPRNALGRAGRFLTLDHEMGRFFHARIHMKKHLFIFFYETPDQRVDNLVNGFDEEECMGVFIEAETENAALEWGRQVARGHVAALYEAEGCSPGYAWNEKDYANWIETNLAERTSPQKLSRLPTLRLGQFLEPERRRAAG